MESEVKPTIRTDMDVDLIRSDMADEYVVQAARVSTKGALSEADADSGLINYLMRSRHGTPFEHNSITFRISAPIFVWREFMRHRIGVSYNEESGRYKQLDPVFYVPADDRKIKQEGKPGAYTYVEGTVEQHDALVQRLAESYMTAYDAYVFSLRDEVAREVARVCLPVAIYSTAYVTMNARSLMAFLSLRTKHENAKFPSTPQREIEMVAEQMEALWKDKMPLTHAAFTEYGRVCP